MSGPNVLVTGAHGHLGYALMCSLAEYGYSPVGIDILPCGDEDETRRPCLTGSIADRAFCESVFKHYPSIRYVLHTATLHKPHIGSHMKTQFVETNIQGTLNLLEVAASRTGENRIRAFVFTSTTSTFGKAISPQPGKPTAWINESIVPVPKNIYGTTKVAAEELCQLVQAETGMPTLVLRISRFFPEADDDEVARAAFSDDNLKICELLHRRVDIADVVTAHVCAMREAERIGWGKYIISAPTPFVKTPSLLRQLDSDAAMVVSETYPEHAKVFLARGWQLPNRLDRVYDSRKAEEELKWEAMYTFERACEQLRDGKEWRSPLTVQVGKRGYHATPTGVYTK